MKTLFGPLAASVNLVMICLIASTVLSIPLPEPNNILVPRDVQPDTGTAGTALYDHPMMHQIRSDDSSADFPLLFPRVKAEPHDDDEVNPSQYPAAAASSSSSSVVVKRPQSPSPDHDGHPPAAIKHELETDKDESVFKLEELKKLAAEGRELIKAKQVTRFLTLLRQFLKYYNGSVKDNSGNWVPNPNSLLVQATAERMRQSLFGLLSDPRTGIIYIKRGMRSEVFFEDSTNPWDPLKAPTLLPEWIKSRLPSRPCAQELLDLGQELLDKHMHDTTDTNLSNTDEGKEGVPSDFLVGWQLKIMAGEWAAGFGEKIPAKNILYLARDAEWTMTREEDSYERKVLHWLTGYLTGIARINGISLAPESNWSPQKRRRDPQDMATGVSKRQKALNSRERERGGAGN
ncbi:hypothetical protein H0H93_011186 [Arthromyces matolae]|nr:hypothetical protein H0H93_011186 [Arthromyces matolae]